MFLIYCFLVIAMFRSKRCKSFSLGFRVHIHACARIVCVCVCLSLSLALPLCMYIPIYICICIYTHKICVCIYHVALGSVTFQFFIICFVSPGISRRLCFFTVYALSCATGGGGKHWSQSICAHFFGVRLVGQEFWLRCWG